MSRLLITGADGYLGRALVRRLLAGSDQELLLWIRARDRREATAKAVAAFGAQVLTHPRVGLTGGDLLAPEPFSDVRADEIGGIVHLAAITAFTVDRATATAVNVVGTRRVLELARRVRAPGKLCLGSTLYVSGLRSGRIDEAPIPAEPEFANEYERSKWTGETLVLEQGDVPVTIVRIATVLADDESGRCGQRNAVHNTLQLLRHGLLTLMPGDPGTPLYLTTGEFAAEMLAAAWDHGDGVYHASGDRSGSLTLGSALDLAFESFRDDADFRRQQATRPRFVDLPTFRMLGHAAASLDRSALGQALGSLLPLAPQLFVHKDVTIDRARGLLADRHPMNLTALFTATCAQLGVGRRHDARSA